MAAYDEYLYKAIAGGRMYEDLPPRILNVLSPSEWKTRVKDQCIQKGLSWQDSLASTVCGEQEYYDDLIKACRAWLRIYPYHLADYICRVQRTTPFRYYCDVLTNMLKDEKSYDRMPNFTAADMVRVLGIGRNEYIAMLNQCKGRHLMWRVNPKGLARDLLPSQPLRPLLQPWWLVSVVNIAESEYRELGPEEVANLKTANLPDAMRVQDLDQEVLLNLYRRGLVYFNIPIAQDDRFSIPPLEGFVSNRTPSAGEAADPLESLLYSVFVASSESLKVSDLAQILNVSVQNVQLALAIAVRLGFATKLTDEGTGLRSSQRSGLLLIDLEDDLNHNHNQQQQQSGTAGDGSGGGSSLLFGDMGVGSSGGDSALQAGVEGGRAVALLLDAEATSYLMMGALSPGLKRHSVTLFEGGRVAGEAVMAELMQELWHSYEAGQGFEGDMLKLTHFVGALATSLEAIKEGSGGRPLELLRKESLAGLPPAAACKVLFHAYCAVVPAAPLPGPLLPLSPDQPGPAYYGPVGEAAGPWLQLALYSKARSGPRSMVLVRGQRLFRLPPALRSCTHALIWPWQPPGSSSGGGGDGAWGAAAAAAGAEGSAMVLVEAAFLLFMLNEALVHTAVMVQPLDGRALLPADQAAAAAAAAVQQQQRLREAAGARPDPLYMLAEDLDVAAGTQEAAAAAEQQEQRQQQQPPAGALLVDVPLPLEEAGSNSAQDGLSFIQGVERHSLARGKAAMVPLAGSVRRAIDSLGLSHCTGVLRMMMLPLPAPAEAARQLPSQPPLTWVPLCISLGLPLHCLPLCRSVCARALAAGFLTNDGRAAQARGQAALHASLQDLIRTHTMPDHEAGSRAEAAAAAGVAGPPAHATAVSVSNSRCLQEPLYNLYFDGACLSRLDVGACLQGAPCTLLVG